MSRDILDRYYTPDALAAAIIEAVRVEIGDDRWAAIDHAVEPSVGGGAFARGLRGRAGLFVIGIDVDSSAPGLSDCDEHVVGDYLRLEPSKHPTGIIIGNPPYNAAEAHMRASIKRSPLVCFLLRASILGSKKRAAFWAEHPPRRVWQIVGRPSFTGGGTDTAEYVAILWDRYWLSAPRLGWLEWKP